MLPRRRFVFWSRDGTRAQTIRPKPAAPPASAALRGILRTSRCSRHNALPFAGMLGYDFLNSREVHG